MLVEFAVAMFPLFVVFFGFVQLARIATARLALKHAAIVAARAAAVISNAGGANPGNNGPPSDIQDAAIVALGPWVVEDSFSNVTADTQDQSSAADPYAMVTVTVRATYQCRVPLGKLLCGAGFGEPGTTSAPGAVGRTMTETVSLPHQGARYKIAGAP